MGVPVSGQSDDGPEGGFSDAELVEHARKGSFEAWAELIDRFTPVVRGVAYSYGLSYHDTEDVIQTVWRKLNDHLPRLREPERVGAWLRVVTRDVSGRQRALLRRMRPTDPRELPSGGPVDERTPETLVVDAEQRMLLVRAIAGLQDATDRVVARLELADPRPSAAQVAEIVGLPPQRVAGVRRRVRRRLRRLLEEDAEWKGRD